MNDMSAAVKSQKSVKSAAKERLERALRANLARRKAQARAMSGPGDHDKNVTADRHSPAMPPENV